mmetsp:Transcript_1057/g.2908  ORF Transcript_1057/g.2908 Transcript_1057/m.2908 type:complete len:302 (+) Transcript_1057:151-1056(+)
MMVVTTEPMASMRPSAFTLSMSTKSAAKKRSVSHSTCCSESCRSWGELASSTATAPASAIQDVSTWCTGWRKKRRMTVQMMTPTFASRPGFLMGYWRLRRAMSTLRWPCTSSRNHQSSRSSVGGLARIVAGATLMMKPSKVTPSSPASMLPMIMFGGSPIIVAAPPMLLKSASEMRYGTGSTSSTLQSSMVTGASSSIVVTLSRKAESTAVVMQSATSSRRSLPSLHSRARTAQNWKRPVSDSSCTRIIMPKSSARVPPSIQPMTISRLGGSPSTVRISSPRKEPISATSVRCTTSETMPV